MYFSNLLSGGFASFCFRVVEPCRAHKAFSLRVKNFHQKVTYPFYVEKIFKLFFKFTVRRFTEGGPYLPEIAASSYRYSINGYELGKLLSCKFSARLATCFLGVRCCCLGIIPFKQVSITRRVFLL